MINLETKIGGRKWKSSRSKCMPSTCFHVKRTNIYLIFNSFKNASVLLSLLRDGQRFNYQELPVSVCVWGGGGGLLYLEWHNFDLKISFNEGFWLWPILCPQILIDRSRKQNRARNHNLQYTQCQKTSNMVEMCAANEFQRVAFWFPWIQMHSLE